MCTVHKNITRWYSQSTGVSISLSTYGNSVSFFVKYVKQFCLFKWNTRGAGWCLAYFYDLIKTELSLVVWFGWTHYSSGWNVISKFEKSILGVFDCQLVLIQIKSLEISTREIAQRFFFKPGFARRFFMTGIVPVRSVIIPVRQNPLRKPGLIDFFQDTREKDLFWTSRILHINQQIMCKRYVLNKKNLSNTKSFFCV